MEIDFLAPGGALSGPLFASLLSEDSEAGAVLADGSRIGAFRLTGLLGRGGGGVVYRAERDDGSFAQSVALKIVRPDPRRSEFLRRERNILGQLSHPGIARIYDGGETLVGEPWYAMELVEGERIDRWCRSQGSDWRDCLQVLIKVCAAVGYAHSRLIVHRDLKPSNLLVTADGQPKLLDFGISTHLHDAAPTPSTTAFTPAFASPEQLSDSEVTTASDIYQLGRLLELLLAQTASLETLAPDRLARRNLRAIVQRATQTLPADRHATVDALRVDLTDALAYRPARSLTWPWHWRDQFFVRRHWLAFLVSATITAMMAAMITYNTQRLSAERDHAQSEAQRALVASEVLANLYRTAAPMIAAGDEPSATELIDRGVGNTLQRLASAPAQLAIAVETLSAVYADLGRHQQASQLLADTIAELDRAAPAWPGQRARLRLAKVSIDHDDDHLDASAKQLQEAEILFDQAAAEPRDRDRLEFLRTELLVEQGQPQAAAARREALISQLLQRDVRDEALYVQLLERRSTQRWEAMDIAGALADLDAGIAIEQLRFGPASPQVFELQRRKIIFLSRSGRADEFERALNAQHALVQKTFGDHSLEFFHVLVYEGMTAYDGNQLDRARQRFGTAHDLVRTLMGDDTLLRAHTLHYLGAIEQQTGNAALALTHLREALAIRRKRLTDRHALVAANRSSIADLLCAGGDLSAAENEFIAAHATLSGLLSPKHAVVVGNATLYADCLLRQHKVAAARRLFDEIIDPAGEPATARAKERRSAVRTALEKAERSAQPDSR